MGIRVSVIAVLFLPAFLLAAPSAAQQPRSEEGRARITHLPERPEQGDALAVMVQASFPVSRMTGKFIDRDLIFFPWGEDAWMAFAPIPVGARTGPRDLEVVIHRSDGTRSTERKSVRVFRHDFDESVLRVDPRFTRPPPEVQPKIREDRETIRRSFDSSAEERLWRVPFVRPAEGRRTGRFGTRRTFNEEVRSRHMGLDLDGSPGDPIYALTDGKVVLAHNLYYAGRSVFLDHGHDLFTVYFHMTEIEVEVGDVVRAGQRIGTIGATGRVTGPHLHLGIRIQGRYVNPEAFLALDLGQDPKAGEEESSGRRSGATNPAPARESPETTGEDIVRDEPNDD